MTESVTVLDHPLVEHHLSYLRAEETRSSHFRQHLEQLSSLLAYRATADLDLDDVSIQTPMVQTNAKRLASRIGLVPILRAGLGMVTPVLNLIPEAEVWHLGFYRDEKTATPVQYYCRLESGGAVDVALILDPMLATGGSAAAAVEVLEKWGVPRIKLLSIIAAPEGIEFLQSRFSGLQICVCAVDERLNDVKFILPGLGDAGDRAFNTPSD